MTLALAIEFKVGAIGLQDLRKRENLVFSSILKPEEARANALLQASHKYPGVRLDDPVVSNEVVIDLLARGVVDHDKLNKCLGESSQFARPEDEPVWRTLCYAIDRDDKVVEAALIEFERMFSEREFVIVGEIQHVFGLRICTRKTSF